MGTNLLNQTAEKLKIEVDHRFLEAFQQFYEKYPPSDPDMDYKEFSTHEIFLAISNHFPFISDDYQELLVALLLDYNYSFQLSENHRLKYIWKMNEAL